MLLLVHFHEGGEVVVVVDVVVGGGIKVILHSKLSDKPISSKATPLTVPVVPVLKINCLFDKCNID